MKPTFQNPKSKIINILDREEVRHVVDDWVYGEMRFGRKPDTPDQTIKVCILNLICPSFSFFCVKKMFGKYSWSVL